MMSCRSASLMPAQRAISSSERPHPVQRPDAPSSAQIWLPSDGAEPQLFGLGRDREPPRDIRAEVRL